MQVNKRLLKFRSFWSKVYYLQIVREKSLIIYMYTSDKLCHTDSKIFPSTRSAFKIDFACPRASDGIQIHCSTQGFSAIKCVQSMRHKARDSRDKFALLLLLCRQIGCSVRGQTRICYIIGFEIIRIHPSTRYRIRCGFIFSHSGERIKNTRIH